MTATVVEERWSTPIASEVTGCSQRQLQHWTLQGYVHPERLPQGNSLLSWPLTEIVRAAIVGEFLDLESAGGRARRWIAERIGMLDLAGDLIVLNPYPAVVTPRQVLALTELHPCVSVVALGNLRERITTRLDALAG